MKTKDRQRLNRIVYNHGSEQLKEKYREWQTGIGNNPKYKEVEKIGDEITGGLMERLNISEHEGDRITAEEIAEQIKRMRKERSRVIKAIHDESPDLERLKNEVITEANNIIRTHQAHRNTPHWNAKEIQRQARQHISDRASDLKKFSDIEGELWNFQQCIEQYNDMQDLNSLNETAKVIQAVPFWTEKRKAYEKKLTKWMADKEKPDPIIKAMPPELFQRIRDEFSGEQWHEHPEAQQRLTDIVPYMLKTVEEWKEKIKNKKTRATTKASDDKKARSKAGEFELTL